MKQLKTKCCPMCQGSGSVPDDNAGATLRIERERAGVRVRDLATAMNISDSFLYDLERGNRKLTNELLESYQHGLKELSDV